VKSGWFWPPDAPRDRAFIVELYCNIQVRDGMGVVECGGVDYTTYYGDITLKRKSGAVKFGKPKNYDEAFALKAKQKIADGDSIVTGKKSFITITGQTQDRKLMQMISVFPESEVKFKTREWEAADGKEKRHGVAIAAIEFSKGTFIVYPAGAKLDIPLVQVEHIDKKRDMKLIIDILPGMTVILPGSRMLVAGGSRAKPHETWPAFGSMGMTELMVTPSGMYERSMEVDERASALAGYLLQVGMGIPHDLDYDEKLTEYTARKTKENKAKTEEALKQMPTAENLEKMKKSGKFDPAALEMASSYVNAAKASGGAGTPAFGFNMLASMDFSKLKDMPGLTAEQRKQIEEGAPMMAEMQKQLAGSGKLAQMTAQANLSAKYMETAANDTVAKKKIGEMYSEAKARLDTFSLPPYPKPDEKYRVK